MNDQERLAVVRACKWVDEVVCELHTVLRLHTVLHVSRSAVLFTQRVFHAVPCVSHNAVFMRCRAMFSQYIANLIF